MRNTLNWLLIAGGGLLVAAELVLGAATGFDLALIGVSISAGGAIGLFFESARVGIFASGALAFLYLVLFRRWIRSRLKGSSRPTGADALVGQTGVVTIRIALHEPGQVKLGDEIWRAVLASDSGGVREPGASVTVVSVDGITLLVR